MCVCVTRRTTLITDEKGCVERMLRNREKERVSEKIGKHRKEERQEER